MPGNGWDVLDDFAQCLAASLDVAVAVASSQAGELEAVTLAALFLLVGGGHGLASWIDSMGKSLVGGLASFQAHTLVSLAQQVLLLVALLPDSPL